MYNPFIEDEFQKRLNEDPTFYVRYVKSRIAEMDKKLNDYIKQEDERLTKQLKNRPPKPRSTINGPRTAIKKPRTADRGPRLAVTSNGLDKRNMETLRESSRKLQVQLDKENEVKKRREHFLKTAKEYGL